MARKVVKKCYRRKKQSTGSRRVAGYTRSDGVRVKGYTRKGNTRRSVKPYKTASGRKVGGYTRSKNPANKYRCVRR